MSILRTIYREAIELAGDILTWVLIFTALAIAALGLWLWFVL